MNGHQLTGPGTLTTRAFTFNYGKLGGSNGSNGTHGGGTLNVTGPATFNGSTSTLEVDYNHTLNLAGNAHWTAGNGRLAVATGGSSGPDAHLNIAASATFTDEGAASASGYKTLTGSRLFTNHGTYLRMGLGETYATGFNNAGLLQVAQGTFGVDANFSNTGRVDVAAGARLVAYSSQVRQRRHAHRRRRGEDAQRQLRTHHQRHDRPRPAGRHRHLDHRRRPDADRQRRAGTSTWPAVPPTGCSSPATRC